MPKQIKTLFAYMGIDDRGCEHALQSSDGTRPLLAPTLDSARSLQCDAVRAAMNLGMDWRLVSFDRKEIVCGRKR